MLLTVFNPTKSAVINPDILHHPIPGFYISSVIFITPGGGYWYKNIEKYPPTRLAGGSNLFYNATR